MTTRLGPATIEVTLDLDEARRQLDALRAEIGRVGASTEQQQNLQNRAQKDQDRRAERITKRAKQVDQQVKGGRFGMVGKLALGAGVAVGAVKAAELLLPPIMEGVAAGAEKIPVLGEDIAKAMLDLERGLVDKINVLAAKVEAAIPSAQQTAEIAKARFLLGQAPSLQDATSDLGIIYQVTEAQKRAERQKNVIFRENLGRMLGTVMSGGAKK